tara:strand:- start:435 stop:1046 length:612 start_codon:yes stop_codon:yes gene_type:complete
MKEVAIIDYGAGNIGSLFNAIEYLNFKPIIIKNPTEKNYSHILLPGVGSFGRLSNNLKKLSLDQYIFECLKSGSYLFGICIGMQLLFEKSEESPDSKGLSLINGNFEKILPQNKSNLPLPHIGFSRVNNENSKLFNVIEKDPFFYFIHSYCLKSVPKNVNFCNTEYGEKFISFVEKDNIFGSQFHPEKSHKTGLKLIKNFLDL